MTTTIGLWEPLTIVRTLPGHHLAMPTMALTDPGLVYRLKTGSPFDEPDPSSFYGRDWRGYTDYPTITADARVA